MKFQILYQKNVEGSRFKSSFKDKTKILSLQSLAPIGNLNENIVKIGIPEENWNIVVLEMTLVFFKVEKNCQYRISDETKNGKRMYSYKKIFEQPI